MRQGLEAEGLVDDKPQAESQETDAGCRAADGSRAVVMQASWHFLHEGQGPLAQACAYQIRTSILRALPNWPHLEVNVRTTLRGVYLTSRTPAATAWLVEHIGKVMAVVADLAGRDLAVWPVLLEPGISFTGRWLYNVPCLVVAKSKKNQAWAPWREEELGDELMTEMTQLIGTGLADSLRKWGALPNEEALSGIRVINAGRPMPIVPPEGPRGMGRIGVQFIAPWSIDGHMSCGHHQLLGYGYTQRGGQVGAEVSGQGDAK